MSKQDSPEQRIKILVVDDNEEIRRTAGRMLVQMGHKAILVEDGAEAVELFKSNKDTGAPFDTVIMDLSMPNGMGGKEAVRELLKIDPKVKVIVSSGDSSDPAIADPYSYGFCSALPKPYTIEKLYDTVSRAINKTMQYNKFLKFLPPS